MKENDKGLPFLKQQARKTSTRIMKIAPTEETMATIIFVFAEDEGGGGDGG